MTKARHETPYENDVNTKVHNQRKNNDILTTLDSQHTISMYSNRIMWISALWLDRMVHFHGMQIIHRTK